MTSRTVVDLPHCLCRTGAESAAVILEELHETMLCNRDPGVQ